jgi:hypothetical protein
MNINYYKSLYMKVLHLTIFLTIIICFCLPSAQSLNMLPLCSVCAQDDGTNCYQCATCYRYATITAGTSFIIKATVIVSLASILMTKIQIIHIVIGVILAVKLVSVLYNQIV